MTAHWIKVEKDTAAKPEVMRLAAILDIDEFTVVGHLIAFWSWVDSNLSPECPQTQGTKRGLDRIAGRTGFCDALISVGWLTFDGDMFGIPNMGRHMGQSAKLRAMDKEKKAKKRSKPASVPQLSPKCPSESGTKQGQKQDKSGTREEKRREVIYIPDAVAGTESQMHTNGQMLSLLTETHESHSPEVAAAAADWNRHLQEKAFDKIPKPGTVHHEKFWWLLSEWGPKRFVAAIEYTIRNGWLNVREEPKRAKGGTRQAVLDIDPDFLRAVEVCREFPSASDYDREQREAKLGPDLMRLVRKITSARLADCSDFNRKALAAEWTINRSSMR